MKFLYHTGRKFFPLLFSNNFSFQNIVLATLPLSHWPRLFFPCVFKVADHSSQNIVLAKMRNWPPLFFVFLYKTLCMQVPLSYTDRECYVVFSTLWLTVFGTLCLQDSLFHTHRAFFPIAFSRLWTTDCGIMCSSSVITSSRPLIVCLSATDQLLFLQLPFSYSVADVNVSRQTHHCSSNFRNHSSTD